MGGVREAAVVAEAALGTAVIASGRWMTQARAAGGGAACASPDTCSSTRRAAPSPPIRSDGFSYYVYLPSWFLYGDSTPRRGRARLLRR